MNLTSNTAASYPMGAVLLIRFMLLDLVPIVLQVLVFSVPHPPGVVGETGLLVGRAVQPRPTDDCCFFAQESTGSGAKGEKGASGGAQGALRRELQHVIRPALA